MSMKENQKMIIVNTNPNLVPTLRDRFSAHIDGFDEKRIINVCESSERILPDILKSILGKGEAKRKSRSAREKVKEEER